MQNLLGWSVSREKSQYKCGLHSLSEDEQQFLMFFCDKFCEFSKTYDASNLNLAKKGIENLLPKILEGEGIEVDDKQLNYLEHAAISHLSGFAPLDSMLQDSSIEEIAVIGIDKPVHVFVRNKGWLKTDAKITSEQYLIHLINKMARPLGRRITYQSPRINALLPNGSRLHASIPPLSDGEITIRLHSAKSWSIKDILDSKSINSNALAFLWLAFQSDSSILIAGNTASGKTTLLNSLFSFVPLDERIVQIEETPEINLSHTHCVKLVSNEDLSIDMPQLVRDSLRMRPDRVIVGEVRTKSEVEGFIETLLSGQARGSYATFHAQSVNEAICRISNLGVNRDDLESLDFICVQRRIARYDPKEKKQNEIRRMIQIHLQQRGTNSLQIFEYDSKSDSLQATKNLDFALKYIGQKLGLSFDQTKDLYLKRIAFLQKLKPCAYEDCVLLIQNLSYGEK